MNPEDMPALNLAIIGPPGAGKGTQAQRLSGLFRVPHISTGQMLRDGVAAGDPIAVRAKEVIDSGALVDDAVIVELLRTRLADPDARQGFLLDGFPRTLQQARALDGILNDRRSPLLVILVLEVPEADLLRRLKERGRADDTETAIRARLRDYANVTVPIIDFYRCRSQVWSIDGSSSPDVVHRDIANAVEQMGVGVRARTPADTHHTTGEPIVATDQ